MVSVDNLCKGDPGWIHSGDVQIFEVEEPVDGAQQVIRGNLVFEVESVEQPVRITAVMAQHAVAPHSFHVHVPHPLVRNCALDGSFLL